jgi:hypothetical protein
MQGLLNALWTHLLPALTAGAGPAGPWSPGSPELSRPIARGPAGELNPMTFRPAPGNEPATLRSVRLGAGELVLADGSPELTAALGSPDAWTTSGPVATAYAWVDGRLHVDVVFAETPHRLHLILDPATGRFESRWQTVPIEEPPLAALRMPRSG